MFACAGGKLDIARELLVARADVNAWDKRGTTALMLTAERGHWLGPCLDVSFTEWRQRLDFLECASLLLRSSAEINDRNHRCRSAVMTACFFKDWETVQLLLGF